MIKIIHNIDVAIRQIKAVPVRLTKATFIELEAAADRVKRAMSNAPGRKVQYPIKWDSDKQRKFVMAKLRRDDNLPYKRTKKYLNGWVVRNLTQGYELYNREPHSMFLSGTASGSLQGALHVTPTGQSHIHEGRWKLLAPTVANILTYLPKRILETFRITPADA